MTKRTRLIQCDGCGKFTNRPLTAVGYYPESYKGETWMNDISVCPDCLTQPKMVKRALALESTDVLVLDRVLLWPLESR